MKAEVSEAVRKRAGNRCEFCLTDQALQRLRFQIDHIIASQHGGDDAFDNLALACGRCDRHKGTNIAGIDPLTRQSTRLFNPRVDRWTEPLLARSFRGGTDGYRESDDQRVGNEPPRHRCRSA